MSLSGKDRECQFLLSTRMNIKSVCMTKLFKIITQRRKLCGLIKPSQLIACKLLFKSSHRSIGCKIVFSLHIIREYTVYKLIYTRAAFIPKSCQINAHIKCTYLIIGRGICFSFTDLLSHLHQILKYCLFIYILRKIITGGVIPINNTFPYSLIKHRVRHTTGISA